MTAAQRAQLLRDRFKGRPLAATDTGAGMAVAAGQASQPTRLSYVTLPKPSSRGFVSCGPAQWRGGPAWVKEPDCQETAEVGLKRRHGAPVLAKVAKHVRPKLARLKLREPWQLAP